MPAPVSFLSSLWHCLLYPCSPGRAFSSGSRDCFFNDILLQAMISFPNNVSNACSFRLLTVSWSSLFVKSFRILVALAVFLFFCGCCLDVRMSTIFCLRDWFWTFVWWRNKEFWLIVTIILALCMLELKLNNYSCELSWRSVDHSNYDDDQSFDFKWFEIFLNYAKSPTLTAIKSYCKQW